jgi:beta-phosphoglucomutase-like phosphatase (HAD superfamily)
MFGPPDAYKDDFMPLALLFDLDGTMVDTDLLHIAAWNGILARDGRKIDAAFYRTSVMGFPNDAVTSALFPDKPASVRAAITEAKETAFRSLVGDLRPTAGLPALLDWAEALDLPMAVVTNAPRDNALLMLRGLGWPERFPTLVIGDELARGKPDPLPYLTALQRLGSHASRAVAFEDSLSGVRAAVAAQIETIGILTALNEDVLRDAGAAAVAQDFTNPRLLELLQRRAVNDGLTG